MFPCSKGHSVRAYLDTIQMTLTLWVIIALTFFKRSRRLSSPKMYLKERKNKISLVIKVQTQIFAEYTRDRNVAYFNFSLFFYEKMAIFIASFFWFLTEEIQYHDGLRSREFGQAPILLCAPNS